MEKSILWTNTLTKINQNSVNIKRHNLQILNENDDNKNDESTCGDRARCSLNDNCLIDHVIYKAIIKEEYNNIMVKIYTSVPLKWTGKIATMNSVSLTEYIPAGHY